MDGSLSYIYSITAYYIHTQTRKEHTLFQFLRSHSNKHYGVHRYRGTETYIYTYGSKQYNSSPHSMLVCLWGSTVFSLVLFSMLGIFSTDSGTHVHLKLFAITPTLFYMYECARAIYRLLQLWVQSASNTISWSTAFQHG